jgi:hypothetical protein
VKRGASLLLVVLAVAVAAAVAWLRKPLPRSASGQPIEAPLEPQTCEEARAYPQFVREEDVRFVECDRSDVPDVEAFRLGAPIVTPSTPSSIDAVEYAPGKCTQKGGGISTFSVFYRPENVDAAIECSKLRCNAGDPVGCEDLGWLYSEDDLGGIFRARRPSKVDTQAAFERGCSLGYAESCLTIASRYEQDQQDGAASHYFALACNAAIPLPRACLRAAEYRMDAGNDAEALPYLVRGCRGTSASSNPLFFADRQGCAILARRAKLHGDMASFQEYLRLECAFGGGERTLAACEELGLLLQQQGFARKAAAYLRKACGALPRVQALYERSCKALQQIELASLGSEGN